MRIKLRREAFLQFCRFILVGIMNTLVTLLLIYVCKSHWGVNKWVSNAIGYTAGFINSFVWNKKWVFNTKSHGRKAAAEMAKFCLGFLLCYGLQLLVTWVLTTPMGLGSWEEQYGNFTLSGYGIATLVGMGVYTMANFVYNRLVAFHE